jgi:hypothetical protein
MMDEAASLVRRLRIFWLLGILAIAGCGTSSDVAGGAGLCPQTAILEDAGQIVRFKPDSERSPADLRFQMRIRTFSGECDIDEKEIALDLRIAMEALRGPANEKGEAKFSYFVAVLGRDKRILVRQEFPVIVEFDTKETKLNFTQEVTVYIPRRKNDSSSDYLVYMGYEMTPEELAYNRRRLNRR